MYIERYITILRYARTTFRYECFQVSNNERSENERQILLIKCNKFYVCMNGCFIYFREKRVTERERERDTVNMRKRENFVESNTHSHWSEQFFLNSFVLYMLMFFVFI